MSLFSNRLRTITGENARFWKSASRLFYYSANRKRIVKFFGNTFRFFGPKQSYEKWLSQTHFIDKIAIKNDINTFKSLPKLSVIIFGDNEIFARQTIDSIKNQIYNADNIIAVNNKIASENKINSFQSIDQLKNSFASEEFVLLLNAGDRLAEDCFYSVAKAITNSPELKCIYFDEDKITVDGKRHSPDFKPGWSPDLLKQVNYISHAFFHHSFITENLNKNASDTTFDILTSKKITRGNIIAIKRVLLSSANSECSNKTSVEKFKIIGEPLISIIIPTRNKSDLVKQCILSVIEKSTYKNYEIILVDNKSDEPEIAEIIKFFSNKKGLRFKAIAADFDFNFSAIINLGVQNSDGEFLVLLNNDMEVISSDWMEQMLAYAQQDHIGVVGAKLLYPDNTIQHAGIVLDPENISRHIYLGKEENEMVDGDALNFPRNYLALTAACVMVSRIKFDVAGKFDPVFMVEFNDIDFCLRVFEKGYYNVFLPDVKFYHYESASRRHPHSDNRSYKRHLEEVELIRGRWEKYINDDPYNTNRY